MDIERQEQDRRQEKGCEFTEKRKDAGFVDQALFEVDPPISIRIFSIILSFNLQPQSRVH